jgi:hypothetical protein
MDSAAYTPATVGGNAWRLKKRRRCDTRARAPADRLAPGPPIG